MVFQLIPYVLRYAPMALLFVDSERAQNLDYYYAMLGKDVSTVSVTPSVTCFLVDTQSVADVDALVEHSKKQSDRLIFSAESTLPASQDYLGAVYDEMVQQGTHLAYDSRLREVLGKETFLV